MKNYCFTEKNNIINHCFKVLHFLIKTINPIIESMNEMFLKSELHILLHNKCINPYNAKVANIASLLIIFNINYFTTVKVYT